MYLPMLSDEELLRYADSTLNGMTDTSLERELIKRFERANARFEEVKPFLDVLESFDGVTATDLEAVLESHPGSMEDYQKLLAALNDADIHTADQLQDVLKLAEQFQAIASDAGDVFRRITTLINDHQ